MAGMYVISNVVGNVRTRLHRAVSSVSKQEKVFILGRRITPTQDTSLTEEQFRSVSEKVKRLVLDGMVVVYTPDKVKITSSHTGEFVLLRGDGASKVLPKGAVPDCFLGAAPKMVETKLTPEIVVPLPALEPEPVTELYSEPEIEVITEPGEGKRGKKKRG